MRRVKFLWWRLVRSLVAPFRTPVVRVWRLGSLEHRIMPTEKAIDTLAKMIAGLKNEDADIVWDAAIDVIELRGSGRPNIVVGPGIKVTREGDVIKVEKADDAAALYKGQ